MAVGSGNGEECEMTMDENDKNDEEEERDGKETDRLKPNLNVSISEKDSTE